MDQSSNQPFSDATMDASSDFITTPTQSTITPPSTPDSKPQKPKGLIVTIIILAVLALAGITFGIYALLDSTQKSSKISSLENTISEKEATIAELDTKASNLETELNSSKENNDSMEITEATSETTTETSSESTNTIELVSEIAETDTTKVYKIGECTADSGTGASSHFSLKCHVTIAGKDALISYHDRDNNILRLSLPKE